jgi:hypothetical protein
MFYPAKSISPHLLDKRRKINVFMNEIATVRHAKSIASQPLALGQANAFALSSHGRPGAKAIRRPGNSKEIAGLAGSSALSADQIARHLDR